MFLQKCYIFFILYRKVPYSSQDMSTIVEILLHKTRPLMVSFIQNNGYKLQ